MTWTRFLNGKELQLHNYYTRLKFSKPMVPQSITFTHAPSSGIWFVQIITLIKQNDNTQFEKIHDYGDIRLYKNKTVYPRAFLVHQLETISDKSALLNRLADSKTYLLNIAFLSTSNNEIQPQSLGIIPPDSNSTKKDSVKFIHYSPNKFILESYSSQTGFLVLSEIYYPGWKAFVDGKSTKIYRTDSILRGIYLEPGKHSILFRYQPTSFRNGLMITLITLIITLIGLFSGKFIEEKLPFKA